MPRKTFAAVLPFLAVLALALPGKAVAGPPEGVSGKMVFVDEVEDWIMKFRRAKGRDKRMNLLNELGKKREDPRIRVIVGETLNDPTPDVRECAAAQFCYGGNLGITMTLDAWVRVAKDMWREEKADLRRRAKQLP